MKISRVTGWQYCHPTVTLSSPRILLNHNAISGKVTGWQWKLKVENWKLKVRSWKLKVESWKIESWKLEVENWKLKVEKLKVESWELKIESWKILKRKKHQTYCLVLTFAWCHQESNRGHKDFQSFALPTELWHLFTICECKGIAFFRTLQVNTEKNVEKRVFFTFQFSFLNYLSYLCSGF